MSAALSPDGEFFGGREWSAESGECFRTLEVHQDSAMSATFFCVARREWSAESGDCFCTLEVHQSNVMSATFSFFFKVEWSAESGECFRSREGAESKVMSTAFSSDGEGAHGRNRARSPASASARRSQFELF